MKNAKLFFGLYSVITIPLSIFGASHHLYRADDAASVASYDVSSVSSYNSSCAASSDDSMAMWTPGSPGRALPDQDVFESLLGKIERLADEVHHFQKGRTLTDSVALSNGLMVPQTKMLSLYALFRESQEHYEKKIPAYMEELSLQNQQQAQLLELCETEIDFLKKINTQLVQVNISLEKSLYRYKRKLQRRDLVIEKLERECAQLVLQKSILKSKNGKLIALGLELEARLRDHEEQEQAVSDSEDEIL